MPHSAAAGWGTLRLRRLSPSENQQPTNYDCCNSEYRGYHTPLLGGDLEGPDLDFITALRVRDSAHRHYDDAADDEKYANPSERPHDTSGN